MIDAEMKKAELRLKAEVEKMKDERAGEKLDIERGELALKEMEMKLETLRERNRVLEGVAG